MKYLSYAWTVIENLIAVFIALLLYTIPNSNFEIAVISILVIIYTHIRTSSSSLGFGIITMTFKSLKQFLHILLVLKRHDEAFERFEELQDKFPTLPYVPPDLYYDDDYSKQELKENEDTLNKMTVQYFINGGGNFLIFIIALYKLLDAILSAS